MSQILNIGSMPVQDNAITKKQLHTYSPYTSSFGPNDEVRIAIQAQDLYVLPSESYIIMEINITRKPGAAHEGVVGGWSTNGPLYLFSEMRYEINNVEIDRIKNPGLTSNMKRFSAYPSKFGRNLNHVQRFTDQPLSIEKVQYLVHLRDLFGFCDDYQKIIMNSKHELIMVINRHAILAFTAATDSFNVKVTKIQWKVPHVQLADQAKLQMLKYLERKQVLGVSYRSWDLCEMPRLAPATKNIWTVKSTTQMSKPRFVLVTFQTDRQTVNTQSHAYDNCDITDIKLYLNTEYYPYDTITCDFRTTNSKVAEQYEALLAIQKAYYGDSSDDNPTTYTISTFLTSPIFAFDCSRTDESALNGTVDIRLEINARENIPDNTVANCLIIYDNYFEYSPFSSFVVKKA